MIIFAAFIIFLLTAIISFIGSVQLGPVNITVIRTSVQKHYTSAVFIGLGGALPELIYSAIALKGSEFLAQYPFIINTMLLICIPVFILVGIYLIYNNSKIKFNNQHDLQAPKSILKSIAVGLGIGLLNPMLLPFWIVVLSTYHQYELMVIPSYLNNIAFIIGTAMGAFLLQYLLVHFLKKFNEKFENKLRKYANLVTAWMFILLGIFQLISFLKK
jgi:threonine/homoserine/homoserine lactone efflux protein